MKAAKKFLGQGNRVKVSVFFRGREVQHVDLGGQLLDRITKVFNTLDCYFRFMMVYKWLKQCSVMLCVITTMFAI